ncbi:Protein BEST-24 [Aphelenchoides avenae]|nr:Protein BEST-24 [Aphelenchus avenae]
MDAVDNGFPKYWVPVNWVFSLAYEQRAKGKITADVLLNSMLQEIRTFRTNLQNLCNYDWVPIPLAYPQVVFLVVRLYFIGCLISRQYIITENVENTSLLVLCVGWVKVAESMLNPFGDDDDDFEANYVIDRNLTIAMSMVDACKLPPQVRDNFHEGDKPLYSAESASIPIHALLGSASSAVLEDERQHVRMVPHVDHIPPKPCYSGLHKFSHKLPHML